MRDRSGQIYDKIVDLQRDLTNNEFLFTREELEQMRKHLQRARSQMGHVLARRHRV